MAAAPEVERGVRDRCTFRGALRAFPPESPAGRGRYRWGDGDLGEVSELTGYASHNERWPYDLPHNEVRRVPLPLSASYGTQIS